MPSGRQACPTFPPTVRPSDRPTVRPSVHLENGQERLLRNLDGADLLHALLPLFLLLEELALARDVPAVALGEHVLPEGGDGLPGDDLVADGGLDRHLVQLSRNQLLEL